MIPIGSASAAPATGTDPHDRLRQTTRQLEGVFVDQLMKAMRDTVPHDGIDNGGAGEDMFTGMFDERMSEAISAQWKGGLSDAMYRQLAKALPADPSAATTKGGTNP